MTSDPGAQQTFSKLNVMLSLNDYNQETPMTPPYSERLMSSQGSALHSTYSKQAIINGRDNTLHNIRQKLLAPQPPSTATTEYKGQLSARTKMQASYKMRASAK